MSCCSLRVCLGVHYNLLLSRDFKYSYKISFLELNLTVEVSAREQVLLSGVFLWVFSCLVIFCLLFLCLVSVFF